jgi:hypothetical protein
MNSILTIIRKLFEPKFTCSQTKVRNAVLKVLPSLSINQIREELEDSTFISVTIDSSNHKHTQFVPSSVRYFVPGFSSSKACPESLLHSYLTDKVVSLSADNTKANFGGLRSACSIQCRADSRRQQQTVYRLT